MKLKQAFMDKVSLESKTTREDELVIYAQINDFDGLKKADSKESHEQWEIKARVGKLRVRRTHKEGLDPVFTMAIKYKDDSVIANGNLETEFDITEDAFNAFKMMTESGMVKDRYVFKTTKTTMLSDSGKQEIDVPGLVYEVDVFLNTEGNYHKWCKIDVELNKLMDSLGEADKNIEAIKLTVKVSNLPIDLSESILSTSEDAEDKAKITKLYEDYFLTKKVPNSPISATEVPAEVSVDKVVEPVEEIIPEVVPVTTGTEDDSDKPDVVKKTPAGEVQEPSVT